MADQPKANIRRRTPKLTRVETLPQGDGDGKRRITEPIARADYLAMGARSLSKLLARYRADPDVIPPGEATLKRWCSKNNWADLAKQHDARVADSVQEAIAEAQVARQVKDAKDLIARYYQVVEYATRPETLLVAARMAAEKGDFAGLARAAVEAGKMAEVLSGGVSDRTEQVGGTTDADDPIGELLARFVRPGGNDGKPGTQTKH